MRVLELYSGIGGVAAALGKTAEIAAAVDQSQPALSVYRHNFPSHPTVEKRVDCLDRDWLRRRHADLWWASPPCQPFTVRGQRRGLDDPRADTFKALLRHLENVRPRSFAMENVEGFRDSDGHDLLRRTLDHAGYSQVREHLLCPSDLGVANRRPRFYLVASRGELQSEFDVSCPHPRLPEILEAQPDPSLWLDATIVRRYHQALHVVDEDDSYAVTSCFTSAYGRSHVRSGSYLRTRDGGLRRFSPIEILRLLGFPTEFTLPQELRRSNAWRLVGNSLSLTPVRRVLSSIGPELSFRRSAS
ncbi:MAG: DNA cytosine methyltransferase [Thermoanaerobaculia bacterium]|nr:DNA cytosine methyltransferase [Thermoanaerobaculia bacterium]